MQKLKDKDYLNELKKCYIDGELNSQYDQFISLIAKILDGQNGLYFASLLIDDFDEEARAILIKDANEFKIKKEGMVQKVK